MNSAGAAVAQYLPLFPFIVRLGLSDCATAMRTCIFVVFFHTWYTLFYTLSTYWRWRPRVDNPFGTAGGEPDFNALRVLRTLITEDYARECCLQNESVPGGGGWINAIFNTTPNAKRTVTVRELSALVRNGFVSKWALQVLRNGNALSCGFKYPV